MSIVVNLPRKIEGKKVLEACEKAAESMGFKAKFDDVYHTEFDLIPTKKKRVYFQTNITLETTLEDKPCPILQIVGVKKGEEKNYFQIVEIPSDRKTTNEEIQKYLNTVSEYL